MKNGTNICRSGLCIFILSMFAVLPLHAQYSAMTYNIRYDTPNDGDDRWNVRKERVSGLINFYEPDILGIQEALHHQIEYLDSTLTNYSYLGVGRDDGERKGEYAAIFYRSDILDPDTSDTFWLSQTPEQVSVGWDASMERISTWAKFRYRTSGKKLRVYNAHLDHRGPQSRLEAVKLIMERAKPNASTDALIVMGDLNALPEDPPIRYLSTHLNDSRVVSEQEPYGPMGTFNGFDAEHPLDARIDYIFTDESIRVRKYGVLSDTEQLHTPSDHLPVLIHFSID